MLSRTEVLGRRGRALVGSIVFLILTLAVVGTSHGGELVPSIGMVRNVDGDTDAKFFGGLALRGDLGPIFMGEIAAAYRSVPMLNDQVRVRMWPIMGTLYLRPVSMLYAGAGVGWYQTSYDYASTVPLADETKSQFGVHVAGGLQLPITPHVGLDLNGRYVMMREQSQPLISQKFNPDFWTTQLGLAMKF